MLLVIVCLLFWSQNRHIQSLQRGARRADVDKIINSLERREMQALSQRSTIKS